MHTCRGQLSSGRPSTQLGTPYLTSTDGVKLFLQNLLHRFLFFKSDENKASSFVRLWIDPTTSSVEKLGLRYMWKVWSARSVLSEKSLPEGCVTWLLQVGNGLFTNTKDLLTFGWEKSVSIFQESKSPLVNCDAFKGYFGWWTSAQALWSNM